VGGGRSAVGCEFFLESTAPCKSRRALVLRTEVLCHACVSHSCLALPDIGIMRIDLRVVLLVDAFARSYPILLAV
jgi:hypothetical protein